MTQLLEGIAPPGAGGGDNKCIFCERDHQEEEAAGPHTFPRNMDKLKREGRKETIALGRAGRYPSEEKPPLIEWSKSLKKSGGYKAAAHHCVALKTASAHKISGELKAAGYDPNDGSNCIWLPYSRPQFLRARAYRKPLQKHRGGHTDLYFTTVELHIDKVADTIAKKFCTDDKQATKEYLLRQMKAEEAAIWTGVASARVTAYQLYNESFLKPRARWGAYDEEKDISREDFIGASDDGTTDDSAAESESAEDPE
jgi:hypothetical protein